MTEFRIEPATEERDATVAALFSSLGVPIRPSAWERAWSEDCPPGFASRPLVAVDPDGRALAFVAARPARLRLDLGWLDAAVLHDFVLSPDADPGVAEAILAEASARADVAIAPGCGPAADPVLRAAGFIPGGWFGRWVFEPASAARSPCHPAPPCALEPVGELPPGIEALNDVMAGERRVFLEREAGRRNWLARGPGAAADLFVVSEGDGLCAWVSVTERAEGELHLVDAAFRADVGLRLGLALADLSRKRRRPLYIHHFGDGWTDDLHPAGFRQLKPRWQVWTRLTDPRETAAATSLLRREAWRFTAADGELDLW